MCSVLKVVILVTVVLFAFTSLTSVALGWSPFFVWSSSPCEGRTPSTVTVSSEWLHGQLSYSHQASCWCSCNSSMCSPALCRSAVLSRSLIDLWSFLWLWIGWNKSKLILWKGVLYTQQVKISSIWNWLAMSHDYSQSVGESNFYFTQTCKSICYLLLSCNIFFLDFWLNSVFLH